MKKRRNADSNLNIGHPALIDELQLQCWLNSTQHAYVERWLRERRIPYDYGVNGQICTTLASVERHFRGERDELERIEFLDDDETSQEENRR